MEKKKIETFQDVFYAPDFTPKEREEAFLKLIDIYAKKYDEESAADTKRNGRYIAPFKEGGGEGMGSIYGDYLKAKDDTKFLEKRTNDEKWEYFVKEFTNQGGVQSPQEHLYDADRNIGLAKPGYQFKFEDVSNGVRQDITAEVDETGYATYIKKEPFLYDKDFNKHPVNLGDLNDYREFNKSDAPEAYEQFKAVVDKPEFSQFKQNREGGRIWDKTVKTAGQEFAEASPKTEYKQQPDAQAQLFEFDEEQDTGGTHIKASRDASGKVSYLSQEPYLLDTNKQKHPVKQEDIQKYYDTHGQEPESYEQFLSNGSLQPIAPTTNIDSAPVQAPVQTPYPASAPYVEPQATPSALPKDFWENTIKLAGQIQQPQAVEPQQVTPVAAQPAVAAPVVAPVVLPPAAPVVKPTPVVAPPIQPVQATTVVAPQNMAQPKTATAPMVQQQKPQMDMDEYYRDGQLLQTQNDAVKMDQMEQVNQATIVRKPPTSKKAAITESLITEPKTVAPPVQPPAQTKNTMSEQSVISPTGEMKPGPQSVPSPQMPTLEQYLQSNPQSNAYEYAYMLSTPKPKPIDPVQEQRDRKLSSLTDLGLLLAEGVGAAAGGAVNRRSETATERMKNEYDKLREVYRQNQARYDAGRTASMYQDMATNKQEHNWQRDKALQMAVLEDKYARQDDRDKAKFEEKKTLAGLGATTAKTKAEETLARQKEMVAIRDSYAKGLIRYRNENKSAGRIEDILDNATYVSELYASIEKEITPLDKVQLSIQEIVKKYLFKSQAAKEKLEEIQKRIGPTQQKTTRPKFNPGASSTTTNTGFGGMPKTK